MTSYDDIINLPHHVSTNHPPMSRHDRAAQFAPFAALVGYEAAVAEAGRVTQQKRVLNAHEQEELNRKITEITEHINEHPMVRIEYFVPDEKKSGGEYVEVI